jgi:hypothetical protein
MDTEEFERTYSDSAAKVCRVPAIIYPRLVVIAWGQPLGSLMKEKSGYHTYS